MRRFTFGILSIFTLFAFMLVGVTIAPSDAQTVGSGVTCASFNVCSSPTCTCAIDCPIDPETDACLGEDTPPSFRDIVLGTSGDDTIAAGDGDDDACGLGGLDTILGQASNDTIDGGADADMLRGQSGNDTICGREGNDILQGSAGDDLLDGGDGDDDITSAGGIDEIIGGPGKDTIHISSGDVPKNGTEMINGGSEDDTVIVEGLNCCSPLLDCNITERGGRTYDLTSVENCKKKQ